ncbi:MAG: hypothetical protein WC783_03690 [Candidatus Paceibacterota bacterium]|jgi:hypothetical protein
MDQKELQEKIALYFSKLTPKAQASFSSMLWLEILKKIADKYSLDSKQVETLSTETTLMLLGVVHTEEYEKVLYGELGLPKEIVAKILGEVNTSILQGIREELNDVYQKNTNELEKAQDKKYEEMDKRFQTLPKDIQDVVGQIGYHDSLYKIFEENKLNIEQMGILENTVMDVLLGNIRVEKFKDALKANLGLEEEKIQKIVATVNEKIFKEVKNKVISAGRTEKEEVINTEEDDKIMKSAGIEINRNGKEEPKIPTPNKFFDSVRMPVTYTDHSLMNITRSTNSGQAKNSEKASGLKTPPTTPTPTKAPTPAPKIISDIRKPISPTVDTIDKKTMPTPPIPPPMKKMDEEGGATVPKPASYLKNKDPYRLSPDE